MDEFMGKVALITGAGRGIGRELASHFSRLGALVAANDINPINLDETVSQIQQAGGNARGFVYDVAKRMPIEGLVAQVLEHFGRIDILVNHASVKPEAPLLDMDEWEFHRTLDVNLGGPYFCMQQVGRAMQKLGGGVMVNLVSTCGQAAAQEGHTAYIAGQAGLAGMTRAAAVELGVHNIRVNAVRRGSMAWNVIYPQDWDKDTFQRWQAIRMGSGPGDHPDLVALVLFLCSQAASAITGQVISID